MFFFSKTFQNDYYYNITVKINVYKHLKFNFSVTSIYRIDILHPTYCCLAQSFNCFRLKVECKSHPLTNSRVPWDTVELCCFKKSSWARMVKILVRYWLRIRSMCA